MYLNWMYHGNTILTILATIQIEELTNYYACWCLTNDRSLSDKMAATILGLSAGSNVGRWLVSWPVNHISCVRSISVHRYTIIPSFPSLFQPSHRQSLNLLMCVYCSSIPYLLILAHVDPFTVPKIISAGANVSAAKIDSHEK